MKILVVVDMQNDFITGSLGTPEAKAIVPNVIKKVKEAEINGYPIIYTQDTHFERYLNTREGKKLPVEHCILGTEGWYIPIELYPTDISKAIRVEKPTFGSITLANFINNNFDISTLDEIELVGLCTDICVVSNALLLKAHFYETCDISVDATCCAGVTPETHEAALKTMECCQINVKR